MNANQPLEHTLRAILDAVNPTANDWNVRRCIIQDLEVIVGSVPSLRGATVEPFGSFVSNLFTRWGDLDISIEVLNGSYISVPGKKFKQNLLIEVLQALRRTGRFHGLKFISHARVPILKFHTKFMNISCDVSINNLQGQMKSKLLYWINEIDGRFREMVLLVKEWAKAHGINDPKNGSLNSYSLSILVIYHFQTCEPPILPPLKEIYPGNMAEDLTGIRTEAERNIELKCADRINSLAASMKSNRSTLSELFISFLAKFCDISVRALDQGLCTYNGQWEEIESNKSWQPKTYALFIEDPFEQPSNTARGINGRNLQKISNAFQKSFQILTSQDQNQIPILDTLVRLEISHIMSKNFVHNPHGINNMFSRLSLQNNPVNNGMNPRIAYPQQANRAMNGASHRHRSQNGRAGSQMNGSRRPSLQAQYQAQRRPPNDVITQRPAQASHSQVQQVWRARPEN